VTLLSLRAGRPGNVPIQTVGRSTEYRPVWFDRRRSREHAIDVQRHPFSSLRNRRVNLAQSAYCALIAVVFWQTLVAER
jgi:hypothetical protein